MSTAESCGNTTSPKCYRATAIVSDVLERLLRETARDGMVRVEDAIKILRLVGRGTYELDVAFEHQEKTCRQEMVPGRDKASSRADVFRRLMVRPFETLLNGDPAPYPRQLLGNFFAVLELAFGEKYSEYDKRSRSLMQALLVAYGNNLDWGTFYADSRVAQILVHALRRLLRYLETPAGQLAWLQAMSRPAPGGMRPSAEQTETIRTALAHTLQGMEMAGGSIRRAASA